MRHRFLATLSVATLAVVVAAPVQARMPRPQDTPLAEANLFISPCGRAYRSKPGEPYPVVQWFNANDTNHDGKLDKKEFEAEAEVFFHELDLRKNGIVDDQIIGLYEKRIVPEILIGVSGAALYGTGGAQLIPVQSYGAVGSPDGPPIIVDQDRQQPLDHTGKTPPGAAAYGLLNDAEPLRSADRNFRGQIRLNDMLAQADRNFDALDVDGKGYLTLDDLPRTTAQEAARAAKHK
jgi:hypothetical protein